MNASGVQASDLLATPLQFFKGVGPRRAADLERAGLHTIEDLLYRFPIRYEDRSRLQAIASLKAAGPAAVVTVNWQAAMAYPHPGVLRAMPRRFGIMVAV